LTFAQAERASPLPTQLKRTDVSQELHAVLWKYIHDEIKGSAESDGFVWYLRIPWSHILEQVHVYHDHQLVSRGLSTQLKPALQGVEKVFSSGDYLAIYGWLQFVLSIYHPTGFVKKFSGS